MAGNPVIAAQQRKTASLLLTSGMFRTAAGAIGDQLLARYQKDLREYLTLRLGSFEASEAAYDELREAVLTRPSDHLRQSPSPRVALLSIASGIAQLRELVGESPGRQHCEPPWAPVRFDAPDDYRAIVELLRTSLPAEDAEVLELRHVRGLEPAKLAGVLLCSEEQASSRLRAAEAYATMLAEDRARGKVPELGPLMRDVCKLDPLPARSEVDQGPPPPLAAGTVLAERYEIAEHVAAGAFGHVYRAVDVLVPGHVVAVKLLHRPATTDAAREGAIRELSLIASAFHPCIVQFKDHGWYDERLWFVMPWYRGETLQERIEREPLSLAEAWPMFEKLARALAVLHSGGIRHQDIKPDNVFLVELETSEGEVPELLPVLLDLGVAAPKNDMALAGTPAYFAPEAAAKLTDAEATEPLTEKADVYALALSLVHAVHPPAAYEHADMELSDFVQVRAREAPAVPKAAGLRRHRERLARWLAFDASERPTARRLADELAVLASGSSGRIRRSAAVPRRPWPWLAVGCLLGLGAAAALLVQQGLPFPSPAWLPLSSAAEERLAPSSRDAAILEQRLREAERRAERLERALVQARERPWVPLPEPEPPLPDEQGPGEPGPDGSGSSAAGPDGEDDGAEPESRRMAAATP